VDGNLRLRCDDNVANDGCRVTYFPAETSEAAETSFLFRVESGVVANGGANDFDQQLILLPPGTNLTLEWSAFIGQLCVRIFANGGETHFFIPNFQWAVDTDYDVVIGTDASTDRYTVSVNGQTLVDDALGSDFTTLNQLSMRSGFTTTGATQVDDVQIVQVPEAGTLASAMAALVTIAAIVNRRRVGLSQHP
jgi:hypothetical protein